MKKTKNHHKDNGQKDEDKFEAIALKFTKWIGSPMSLVIHTIFFLVCFGAGLVFGKFDQMLLFLTTILSLEAIYLAILIQLTVNKNTKELVEVGKDIDEIQVDIDEIQTDVGEIHEDIDEIQEDVDEIQEDVEEIQGDVDDIEEGETAEVKRDKEIKATVESIQKSLEHLMKEINNIKK